MGCRAGDLVAAVLVVALVLTGQHPGPMLSRRHPRHFNSRRQQQHHHNHSTTTSSNRQHTLQQRRGQQQHHGQSQHTQAHRYHSQQQRSILGRSACCCRPLSMLHLRCL